MAKRPLPASASAALDIIVGSGSREIHANHLGLLMQQRGFNARDMNDALRSFERRGWLLRSESTIEITQAAFDAEPVARKPAPKRKGTRLPRGLFSG